MIKREVVDEVIARNDIESLIGSYVTLKRAGSNLKGLCPFHSEKTPSFTVYPNDNSFYCFGCGVGGNAVTFIRQIEHLDYPDAVRFLAKRAGISYIPDDDDVEKYEKKTIDKARLYAMNTDAAKFFHQSLLSGTPDAENALSYFRDKRRLSMATIRHFGLGYAPNSFTAFSEYMRKLGYQNDEMVAGFLMGKNERGTCFDAFRNRVMFPIIDVSGNIIAFGGRVMDDSKPKYKNSSDTPVFKKTRNLFALNFARMTCAETMILCEGYMDVIALHAAGITNAVATLGTALTQEQCRLMSRYTKKVVICYDSDEAGQKAATRAIPMLSDVGLQVSVLKIPGAKDPDEYIKEFGKDKFLSVLNASKTKFEYHIDSILEKYNTDIPQEKINALKDIEKLISGFYSEAEREIYIRFVGEKLSVSQDSIRHDVNKMIAKTIRERMKAEGENVRRQSAGYADKVNPDFVKAPLAARAEETVLGLLLLYDNHRKSVIDGGLLTEDDFYTALGKRIFTFLSDAYKSGVSDPIFDDAFTPEEIGRMTKMKISRMQLTDNGDAVMREAIDSLRLAVKKETGHKASSLSELQDMIRSMQKDNQESDDKGEQK